MKSTCRRWVAQIALGLSLIFTAGQALAQTAYAIDNTNNLIKFQVSTPGVFTSTIPVTGLAAGEFLQAIDYRPATQQLYAFGSTSQLYIINTATGTSTLVGPPLSPPLAGARIGMDFNPTVDRLRLTSSAGENVRVNPGTGAYAGVDVSLAFAAGDPHFGSPPAIDGTAYANNFPGAATTTLYGYDFATDSLVIINPPNNGTLNTVGSSGVVTTTGALGFDIVTMGGVNTAYATLVTAAGSGLYTIDLSAGTATLVGAISGNTTLRGLAVVPPPTLMSIALRRTHGVAGDFDLPLSLVTTSPTTEPRLGPTHHLVYTFDKSLAGGAAGISEGTIGGLSGAVAGTEAFVDITGVTDIQYATVFLVGMSSSDGGIGGTGTARVGFLAGDVNQTRVVSIADLGLVNAQLSQPVTPANFLKDVNASGAISVADKGLTNANLTKALPAP